MLLLLSKNLTSCVSFCVSRMFLIHWRRRWRNKCVSCHKHGYVNSLCVNFIIFPEEDWGSSHALLISFNEESNQVTSTIYRAFGYTLQGRRWERLRMRKTTMTQEVFPWSSSLAKNPSLIWTVRPTDCETNKETISWKRKREKIRCRQNNDKDVCTTREDETSVYFADVNVWDKRCFRMKKESHWLHWPFSLTHFVSHWLPVVNPFGILLLRDREVSTLSKFFFSWLCPRVKFIKLWCFSSISQWSRKSVYWTCKTWDDETTTQE